MWRSAARYVSFAFLAALAYAQTTSTSILGTVTDKSGAVVAGAKITARNVGTGVARAATTTNTGDFNFPLLDVGTYDVTVEMPGFKTETRSGIGIQINDKARIDFNLQVGTQSDVVEVRSEAALLQTDEASLGQVVGTKRISELPLINRNLAGVFVLQPGVQYGGRMGFDGQTGGGGGVPIPGASISISANGQRDTNQHATLDGVVATEARVNTLPFTPSIEAIAETRVLTGSYSAEYGSNSGAQITIVMKSGTNQLHGAAFEFLRNDVLDAESYFQNFFNPPGAARRPKNALRQNQYGGVISGPVVIPKLYNGRDKTFFMFNYEARKRREPGGIGTATYPTTAFRNGDFSTLLNRGTDSRGNVLAPIVVTDPLTGSPFPGNIIPANRIAPSAKSLLSFFPVPQFENRDFVTGGLNFIGTSNLKLDDDQRFVRIDHNFSDHDKVFGRYAFQDISYLNLPGDNPNFTYAVAGRNQNLATQWVHIFTPAVINELRYGYNRSVDNTLNPRSNTDFDLDTLGLTGFRVVSDNNRKFTSREAGLPNFNVQGITGIGDRDGGNGFDFNNLHQINDNLTINRGAHNMKAGFDYRWVGLRRGAANVARGTLGFNGDIANYGFAAFLLGYPSTADTPEGLPLTNVRQNRYAGYFLDDWKATRKLTLNLGLRYEYNGVAKDIDGLWRSMEFRNGLPTLLPDIGTPYEFYTPEKKLFMPRIGLAYRITDGTVLRSAYGIYYNVHQLNNYTILNLNPPLSGSSQFAQTATNNGALTNTTSPLTFANPFGVVNNTRPTNANALNTDNFQPRINQWSFDIQRQLPWSSVLTVGYVGSKGVHIDNTVELNNPDPGLSTTSPQLRRPYQFIQDGINGPIRTLNRIRWLDSGANSWYHGLQINLEKRFSQGLTFGVAHTYSKAMGEGYGRNEGFGFVGSSTYQDPRNRAADKTRYPFDVRHNTVINFLYEIPTVPAFKQNAGKYLLGGWQANGVYTIRTGFPFTVTQGNTLNTFNSPTRPDRIGNGTISNPNRQQWFNPDDFRVVTCLNTATPDLCHYGNSGVGILDGPGFRNLDFSLFKNIPIGERFKLQFRAEATNIFNTPNFTPPNSSLTTSTAFLPSRNASGQLAYPTQAGRLQGPGEITGLISPMRQMQMALKFLF